MIPAASAQILDRLHKRPKVLESRHTRDAAKEIAIGAFGKQSTRKITENPMLIAFGSFGTDALDARCCPLV
jgi:hypothetical protein